MPQQNIKVIQAHNYDCRKRYFIYQKNSSVIVMFFIKINGTLDLYRVIISVRVGKRYVICFRKCTARPERKLRSSKILTPALIFATQLVNLPLPLPILEPETFLVSGKCGNTFTHKRLFVLSARRTDFFKKILYLKICLLFNLKGCKVFNPNWP